MSSEETEFDHTDEEFDEETERADAAEAEVEELRKKLDELTGDGQAENNEKGQPAIKKGPREPQTLEQKKEAGLPNRETPEEKKQRIIELKKEIEKAQLLQLNEKDRQSIATSLLSGAIGSLHKKSETGIGRQDLPQDLEQMSLGDYQERTEYLKLLAQKIKSENEDVVTKFFALRELNIQANGLGKEMEGLKSPEDKLFLEKKNKKWQELLDQRKKLFLSIKGADELEAQISAKTQGLADAQAVEKESQTVSDGIFNEFAANTDNAEKLYAKAIAEKKDAILEQMPVPKNDEETNRILKMFGQPGLDVKLLPAWASAAPSEARVAGKSEKGAMTNSEVFLEEAPSWALAILLLLIGGMFKFGFGLMNVAMEIGEKGFPVSLLTKAGEGLKKMQESMKV